MNSNRSEKSEVYFISAKAKNHRVWWDPSSSMLSKLERIFYRAKINEICKGKRVAVKMHFGEPGNTHYIRPCYASKLTELVKNSGAKSVEYIETSGLGMLANRTTAKKHLEAARKNGFTRETIGAEIVFIDGGDGLSGIENSFAAKGLKNYDTLIALSHLTAHIQAGFGGAIKNIALGCVTKKGKYFVHYKDRPEIDKSLCNKCNACIEICPKNAIRNYEITSACEPCSACMDACNVNAIKAEWNDNKTAAERIAYNAYEVLRQVENHAFITLAVDILPHCDCHPFSDIPFRKDIGILASRDIVAIDKACLDLLSINGLKNLNPDTYPEVIISKAEELGLGKSSYELTEIE